MKRKQCALWVFAWPLFALAPKQEAAPVPIVGLHSLQEVIDIHTKELREHLPRYDHLFVVTNLDHVQAFDKTVLVLSELNAHVLRRNDQDYLMDVRIEANGHDLRVRVANFKVMKMSNNRIELLNLNNGHVYLLQ
ncbi:hypothetical protein [Hymenobacter properus]|uniref:Uncharacterized protein n=1 Tax=Hymenobacter properus TaxID=2791026 RepID=A0A931FHF7_9BACT|nr:hypothetical protein [Hymenobacter properus]MBF9141027.1 hypothetical protein [Hymenobacter properus]MBR7719836.1 hypothetical protein [Microvirga sp. SRT04]